jgi:hypothetical protein
MWRWPKYGGVEDKLLFNGEENIYDDVESNDVENDGGNLGNRSSIKHVYRDNTWKYEHFMYNPKLQDFVRVSKPNLGWNQFPTMMQLFDLF